MIIYGYPGTGKTHLTKRLRQNNALNVLESDEYLQDIWPVYFKDKLYENEKDRAKAHVMVSDYVLKNYNKYKSSPNFHFITNIHPTTVHPKLISDYAFYHETFAPDKKEGENKKWDANWITQLRKWNDMAIQRDSKERHYAENFILLPNNEYMADYFQFHLNNLLPI